MAFRTDSTQNSPRGTVEGVSRHHPSDIVSDVQETDRSAAIRLENVTKRFGDDLVFEDLSVSVPTDEFLCLLGPSGCGKTTLLHMIAGLEPPTQGSIRVAGEPVDGPDFRRGIVFQDPRLYPWLDVADNVAIGPRLRGEQPNRERIETLLELVGLGDVGDRATSDLSGGMAQRVSLARTLLNDPELLLLDEPFSALDELTKFGLQDELRRIVAEFGLTTVFVTHDIAEAVYLGDRVAVLGTGSTGINGTIDTRRIGREDDDPAAIRARRSILELLEDDLQRSQPMIDE